MSIRYSVVGQVNKDRPGETKFMQSPWAGRPSTNLLDVSAELAKIMEIVSPETLLRITIETVDD